MQTKCLTTIAEALTYLVEPFDFAKVVITGQVS